MSANNYFKLENHFRKISSLTHVYSMVSWDEAVNMPKGGGERRGQAMADTMSFIHDLQTAPEVLDWIEEAEEKEQTSLNEWQQRNLAEIKRTVSKARAVSSDLVNAKGIATARCQQKWRSLRAENNWKDFLPELTEVFEISKKIAIQRSEITRKSPYDSLIETFDPGLDQEKINKAFDPLKQFLPSLIQQCVENQKSKKIIAPKGSYPIEKQKALGLEIMKSVGFDFNHGRLDISHHPFCGGDPADVRITTRYDEKDFTSSLMGVIHETGHASYEQGLPKEWANQPVGKARGMSIHEGQSLLFEMQMSRSESFLKFSHPLMKKYLGDCGDGDDFWDLKNINALSKKVEPGLIRVDADEVTYPAHILLRYEAEKKMFSGDLLPEDLPEFWNQQMQELLALDTKGNFKDGCMQDMHWSAGAFGYFPSYTLGAMTAAQLFKTATDKNPSILSDIESGRFETLLSWLKKNVWSQGSKMETDALLTYATGEPLNPKFFEEHLKNRYLG